MLLKKLYEYAFKKTIRIYATFNIIPCEVNIFNGSIPNFQGQSPAFLIP